MNFDEKGQKGKAKNGENGTSREEAQKDGSRISVGINCFGAATIN
jgi:hypothetical protein